jgi:hypothetical protein
MKINIAEQVKKEISPELNKEIGDILKKGYNTAVRSTPVDTGQMRASWVIGYNDVYYSEQSIPSHHSHGRDLFGGRKASNTSKMNKFIDSLDFMEERISGKIIISNGMDYSSYVDKKFGIIPKIMSALKPLR